MEDFHFLRPIFLIVLPFFWWGLRWISDCNNKNRNWNNVVDEQLRPFVLEGGANTSMRGGAPLFLVIGTLIILGISGPTWKKLPAPVFRTGSGLVIALDLSASMNASDLEPSRLEMARFKISDLLAKRKEGQVALLVYAAKPFVVTPLTNDLNTVNAHLRDLDTSIMPRQGSAPLLAIAKANTLLHQGGIKKGHILMVTDGSEESDFKGLKSIMDKYSHSLSILGTATYKGAPIPLEGKGFARNQTSNELIISKLEERVLRKAAKEGRGVFVKFTPDSSDVTEINNFLLDRDIKGKKDVDLETNIWSDSGPWLLLATVPLMALAFRKGVLLLLFISLSGLPTQNTKADLWLNEAQKAYRAFENGDYGDAAKMFEQPDWKGSSLYRSGDFENAAKSFSADNNLSAIYNYGTALARSGRFEEALDAFDKAIELDSSHEDAIYNREQILEYLKNREENDSQNSPKDTTSESEKEPDQTPKENQQASDSTSTPDSNSQPSDSSESSSHGVDKTDRSAHKNKHSDIEDQNAAEGEDQENDNIDEKINNEMRQTNAERALATEQWLKRIPDDPSGLLRRKFLYQYQESQENGTYEGDPW